jgi:glycopeptide antibiotics resistance protein
MIHFFPYPLLIGLGILAALLLVLQKRGKNPQYLFFFFLFGIYILVLIDAVLFPVPAAWYPGERFSRQNLFYNFSRVNLTPFTYGNVISTRYLVGQILQNILMTLPLGLGIGFIACLKARDYFWLAAVTGCATELAQLLAGWLLIGGPYRSVDINDSLLNALGVLAGYALFRVFAWVFVKLGGKSSTRQGSLMAFLLETARRTAS